MEKNEKLYDQFLTEGVRWLAYNQGKFSDLSFYFEKMDIKFKLFLEMARMYTRYGYKIYIETSWLKFFWLKYIKKYTFLSKAKLSKYYFNIEIKDFMNELIETFNCDDTIINEIYHCYFER